MTLPGTPVSGDDLRDVRTAWPAERVSVTEGHVSDFVTDEVRTPDGDTLVREFLVHPGAVAVMALDEEGRVAVVTQYRHPAGFRLVEPPAGLLDLEGEDFRAAAERELAEEAGLAADDWRVLVDVFTSPGCNTESIRVYLARSLREVSRPDGFVLHGEEADMGLHWAALDELVDGVYAGRIQSPTMVLGALALHGAIQAGRLDELRPADAPWPARDALTEKA